MPIRAIGFEFKPHRFVAAMAYLVDHRPGLTKKQICKLLFLADKSHLLQYGRTITGDHYYALEQGPIPTNGLDAINGKGMYTDFLRQYGELDGWVFRFRNKPDLNVLSKSDLRALDEVLSQFGDLPAWRLEQITHEEPAWKLAPQNGRMDFELFFEGHPESEAIKEVLLEENQ